MRADRLLSALLVLQSRSATTAPRLARELGVSVRTVYRDVEALSAAGVPVWSERGPAGGIRLLPGWRTDVTGLSTGEARALFAFAGRPGADVPGDGGGAGGRGATEAGGELARALRKLLAALPEQQRPEVERARSRVLVDPVGWGRSADPVPQLAVVQEAVWGTRRLRLRYRHSGEPGDRTLTLDPLGLVVLAGVWYLVATHRRATRVYRVSRIGDARVLAAEAVRPAGFDLARAWADLRFDRPGRPGVEVDVAVAPGTSGLLLRMCATQLTGPAQQLAPDGSGRVVHRMPFRALAAARAVLLGFGCDVEVLAPAGLRAELASVAADVVRLYRGTTVPEGLPPPSQGQPHR